MPILQDFSLGQYETATIQVNINSPTNIGGRTIRYLVQKHFGGISGIVQKWAASGFGGGQSGITIVNSGQGIINIALNSSDMSGQNPGAYAYDIELYDNPRTITTEGFILLGPGTLP